MPSDTGQAGDALAAGRWGLRTLWWLILCCVVVVGVLLPLQQLGAKPRFSSESIVVASDLTADLKVLPRYGEAVFDNGQVARAIIDEFGDAGDPEDVVPIRASVVTEQDSLVFRVQGHARDAQTSADIANAAAEVFTSELNKVGSGIGTFAIQSSAIPPVESDEPLRAAPYSVSIGLVAGLVVGLGCVLLVLVIRRPVVEALAATRTTDLPVFGIVTLPHTPRGSVVPLEDISGLAPLCRQVLDWSPEVLVLTGPPGIAVERHHLAVALSEAFDQVRHRSFAPAPRPADPDADASGGPDSPGADRSDVGAITVIDGSDSIDLVAPGPRSFILLVVQSGVATSELRRLAGELKGVPTAIVLVQSRRRRRRRRTAGRAARRDADAEPARTVEKARQMPRNSDSPTGQELASQPTSRSGQTGLEDGPADVLAWVAKQAAQWFPDKADAGASLRVVQTDQRRGSRLYEIEVRGRGTVEKLVVKQRAIEPTRCRRGYAGGERPLNTLAAAGDDETATQAEYLALRAIHGSLSEQPSRRLAAVEPFDLHMGLTAIAMEHAPLPTLHEQTMQDLRASSPAPGASPVLPWSNAGVWLKRYQTVLPADGLPVLRGSRSEVVDLIQLVADFLAPRTGSQRKLHRFADQASAAAELFLGDELAVSPVHGDFATDKIFVLPDGSVAVIDPLPLWQAPAFEDLGRLLVMARSLEPASQRPDYRSARPHPRIWETALLAGYFGPASRLPVGPMRVFLALCTLDRWAELVSDEPPGRLRRQLRSSQVAANRYYLHELRDQSSLLLPNSRGWHEGWV